MQQPRYIQISQHDLYGHVRKMNWHTRKFENLGIAPNFHFYEELCGMKIAHSVHQFEVKPELGNVLLKVADNGLLMQIDANYDTTD